MGKFAQAPFLNDPVIDYQRANFLIIIGLENLENCAAVFLFQIEQKT